jgi:hypothetical protein
MVKRMGCVDKAREVEGFRENGNDQTVQKLENVNNDYGEAICGAIFQILPPLPT